MTARFRFHADNARVRSKQIVFFSYSGDFVESKLCQPEYASSRDVELLLRLLNGTKVSETFLGQPFSEKSQLCRSPASSAVSRWYQNQQVIQPKFLAGPTDGFTKTAMLQVKRSEDSVGKRPRPSACPKSSVRTYSMSKTLPLRL